MGTPEQQSWFENVWLKVQSDLRNSLDERRYEFWVKPIRFVSGSADRVVLSCINHEARERLVPRFGPRIAELIHFHAQRPIPVDFIIDAAKPQLVNAGDDAQQQVETTESGVEGAYLDLCPALEPRSIVLSESSFGTLVVVPSGGDVGEAPQQASLPSLVSRRLTTKDIIRHSAAFYGIRTQDLLSKSRERAFVRPRQRAIYLTRSMLDRSYPQIGKCFDLDHTSCIHAFRRVTREIETNPQAALEVETLRQAILEWSRQAGEGPTLQ